MCPPLRNWIACFPQRWTLSVLSQRACTTRPVSWSAPTAKGVGEGGHMYMGMEGEEELRKQCMLCRHGKHAVGLNTFRACKEQQTVQVLTHAFIYTLQTSHKGTTRYKCSIYLGYTSSSIDKLIVITTGKYGIQSMKEWRLDVNGTRQHMCHNLQAWTRPLQSRTYTLILQDPETNKTRARLDYTRQGSLAKRSTSAIRSLPALGMVIGEQLFQVVGKLLPPTIALVSRVEGYEYACIRVKVNL